MNLIRKASIVFALVFALMPELGFAQYMHTVDPFWSNLSNPQRYELGGGIVMPSGSFTGSLRVEGPGSYYRGDSLITRKLPAAGFGGSIGLAMPFKATGHISCWAVAVSLQANMYTWDDLNPIMGTDGTFKPGATSLSANTLQVALPIGIDWKVGNDAILTKRLVFAAAFGAGAKPQIMRTGLPSISGFEPQWGYGVTPYVKFDWSIFLGLCWKVRVMYDIGNINLLDVNHRLPGLNDAPFTLSSGSALSFSLIVMPFSGGWKEYSWYNTYDTYNQHDRFN